MTDRVVSPNRSDWEKLPALPTAGEKRIGDFFIENLPEGWEVYFQPFLNGLRPDFVLLNPQVGIVAVEVKDWSFSAVEYRTEVHANQTLMYGRKKGDSKWFRVKDNPFDKIRLYQREILDVYCPELPADKGFAVVTTAVIFTNATQQELQRAFPEYLRTLKPEFDSIASKTSLQEGNIFSTIPACRRDQSFYMSEDNAIFLRSWLIEPLFAQEQRRPLDRELDPKQIEACTTRTDTGFRRIRGAAGSGKSMVLAARAATLYLEGKDVLVVTFNITILNFLRDMAVRWPRPKTMSRQKLGSGITWLNFHSWAKRVCFESGNAPEYRALGAGDEDNADDFTAALVSLVSTIVNDPDAEFRRYDAILVDEGQDFDPSWWQCLRRVVEDRPDTPGERVLVADVTQDLYETADRWTDDAMKECGFRGPWYELSTCYRLPRRAIDIAGEFARRYLDCEKSGVPTPPQQELELESVDMNWIQVPDSDIELVVAGEIQRLVAENNGRISLSDVTVMCPTNQLGAKVTSAIGSNQVQETCIGDRRIQRRKRVAFYQGRGKIRVTTPHSFKGWESSVLIAVVTSCNTVTDYRCLYVALTRLLKSDRGAYLTVICADEVLSGFGRFHFEYSE